MPTTHLQSEIAKLRALSNDAARSHLVPIAARNALITACGVIELLAHDVHLMRAALEHHGIRAPRPPTIL